MINWTQTEETLFPDEHGAMFSGCAVVDKNNLLKLKNSEHDTVVLFYTAAGNLNVLDEPKGFTQCMAYSTDGAKTFIKYENNPIIDTITFENRDPKVVYDEKSGCYIMALYLENFDFAFFKSDNLKDWKKICSCTIENESECPDFYLFKDNYGEIKWVFSGASDFGVVGNFDADKGFFNFAEPKKFGFGRCYAAQSFFGIENRRIRMSWNKFWKAKTHAYTGAMGTPCEITLENGEICIAPVREIEKYYTTKRQINNFSQNEFMVDLKKSPVDITIDFKNVNSNTKIEIFGNEIEIDIGKNMICVTESDKEKLWMPFEHNEKMRIIADDVGTEIFFKHFFGAFDTINNYEKNYVLISGEVEIKEILINEF